MSNITQFFAVEQGFDTSAALGCKVIIPTITPAPLICKAGGTAWIVAPNTAEVSRTWYCREDAVTQAKNITGSLGWFVPTVSQLQNPGYTCRTFWDSFRSTTYWSSTESDVYVATNACGVVLFTGAATLNGKNSAFCVRAFRVVTY